MSKRKPSAPKPPAPALVSASNFKRNASIGLFLLGALLYANTLFFDYAVDDAIVIYDNEFTCKGTAGFGGLLKYDTFRGFFKVEGKEKLVSGGRYRPLTPLMYATEVQLFAPKKRDAAGQPVKDKNGDTVYDPNEGGKLNAVKFVGHLVNMLLYGLTGVLLFWFLLKILSPDGKPTGAAGFGPFVALAAALLFVVHPVHSEVVANVKGRDEILSLLGSLAALYLSLKAFYEGKKGLSVAAAIVFFLALLSKENAITFVAIVPLTYYFFTKANTGKIIVQTLPFLAAAAVFIAIRIAVLGLDFGGEPPRELMNNPFLKLVGNQYVDFSFAEKTATNFFTLGKYLLLLVFPHPLSHDYYPRAIPIRSFGDWQVILAVLAHLALLVFALLGLRKRDPVSYGILFYLLTLSIASNFVFPIGTNMNERFLYMPSIGFAMVVATMLYRLTDKTGRPKPAVLIGGIAVLLAFSVKTFTRNFAWKNNFTLFTTDIKTVPNSAKLRNATGGELVAQSLKPENAARKTEMLNEAVGHLNEAMKIHPGYKNPLLILGNAYNYLQQYEASIQAYEQALKLDPEYTEAKNNLAITCRQAGQFFGEKQGDIHKAFTYLNRAFELDPNDYETLRLLGVANGVSGNGQKAVEFFTKALEKEPNNAAAYYNLASAYYNIGQPDKTAELMAKAKEINPNIEAEMRGGK
ncbi:MAG: tetratricopeptide repeat protein [Saprospiraceae bacterium]|nr:tetratricopeptide repeat protein [Saprospiraceae bacterium]MCF8252808.1 tetratricopeptide repeat protein [Saprospiraceae bacterium]MCF8283241.1 tetratricopeptide repeat protein [Bacteroidales bacterium]MCF8314363.1 tetratricopeptide repeat protein [Saprospiraceae bacterium]MCF8443235.1 tetratricopeptide repeat protein [Saprospiraceae bacterium]